MSLFGGSDAAPSSQLPHQSDNELSQPSSAQSSPIHRPHTSPPSAQITADPYYATESGAEDDLLSDSESELDESDHEQTRPNRFRGKPKTWRGYTEPERQVAASLEQIQNADLAAHLYNAHALRRRVRRKPEDIAELSALQSKEYWLKKGKELAYTDISGEIQTELVPSNDWTAWPLPPEILRRSNDFNRDLVSEHNDWTMGNLGAYDEGAEMREELLATFLRSAKERWNSRLEDNSSDRGRDRDVQSRSRSRSRSVRSQRSASRTDVEMRDGEDSEGVIAEVRSVTEGKFDHIGGKRRGRAPQIETNLQPTFLADDAKASRILEPSINSLLTRLDELALAIQRTRRNHFGRGSYSDYSSQNEFTSDAESHRSSSRSSSRPQSKRPQSKNKSTSASVSRHNSASPGREHGTTKAKSPHELDRRTTSADESSPSENDSDSHAARLQPIRKRGRSASTTEDETASVGRGHTDQRGLMDWSEVLGLAAVKGWNEQAVRRTAERCAALFGESMSFMAMEMKPEKAPTKDTPSTASDSKSLLKEPPSLQKRPFYQPGSLRCPHVDCPRHKQDFKFPYRTAEHCVKVHGYDPRKNDAENEDRLLGGVHIDGFLQPIAAPQGRLGRGRSQAGSERKKQKRSRSYSTGAPQEAPSDSG